MKLSTSIRAVCLAFLAFGTHASAQCTPGWTSDELVGVDNRAYAQIVWDPDGAGPAAPVLVVAGQFTFAGAQAVQRIATWDGQKWSALPGGGPNAAACALAVYNGSLIAAGDFTQAGGTPAQMIARYTGSGWQPLDTGFDGPVYALQTFGTELFAGGVFTTSSGQFTIGISRWNGATWQVVGSASDGPVYALQNISGNLYAGGSFSTIGGASAHNIARWNGSFWSALDDGVNWATGTPIVRAITPYLGSIVVAGQFDHAGPTAANSIATWDGQVWSAFGDGLTSHTCPQCQSNPVLVRAAIAFNGQLYAGGDVNAGDSFPLLYSWNGSAWTKVPGSQAGIPIGPEPLNSLAVYNGGLYAAGYFSAIGFDGYANSIGRWNGTQWTKLGGIDLIVHALNVYGGHIVAGGEFSQIGGVPAQSLALFDGTAWNSMNFPNAGTVASITVDGSQMYVLSSSVVSNWSGTTWTTLGTAPSQTSKVFAANGVLYAIGYNGVQRWNGASWVAVGSGVSAATAAIQYNGNTLFSATVLGVFSAPVRWNGLAWIAATPPFQGNTGPMTLLGSNLAVAFGEPAVAVGRVALWNGSSWTQLGAAFDGPIQNMASVNGKLYVTGAFTSAGGTPASHAAVWDGSTWSAMDAGLDNYSYSADAIGFEGKAIFAGSFRLAGERRGYLATWNCQSVPCYANCDGSTSAPLLTANDFQCFLNKFASADPTANCDNSTSVPILTANDFQCFLNSFAAGCT